MQLSLGKDISMRSVDHAAELAGGYDELAKRLGVRAQDVIGWSRGASAPNTATLLFILDLIMQETQKLSSAAMAFELGQKALAKARDRSKLA